MIESFVLKHENDICAIINIEDYNEILDIQIIDESKLPLLSVRNGKTLTVNLKDWIKNRGVPAKRRRLRDELITMNCSTAFELMLKNLGLSLVDHFWISPLKYSLSWEQVNFYNNNFRATMTLELKDDFLEIDKKVNFIPSASLKGDLKKKWIIGDNGVRYLVKGNCNNTCRQSISEVIASEIHKRQGIFEYTPYEYVRIYSDNVPIIGCKCPNFTSINTEFIPAIDLVHAYHKDNSISELEHYIRICTQYGIDESYMRNWVDYCILTNFIITNVDWHLNNFGIIVDSDTRTHGKIAPIFDSGNSLFYNCADTTIKVGKGLLNIPVTSWKDYEIQLLQYVRNPNIVDISKLPSAEEILNELQKDKCVSQLDNERIVKAYSKKVEYLEEFQSGVKIYSYDYLTKHGVKLRSRKEH